MRTQTTRLLEMMDEGLISATAVAEMALAYMSEDDVADMMRANDILDEDEEDEEWDGQPDEAQEWESFDADCTLWYVRKGLIEHDGYPCDIIVKLATR